MKHARKIGFPVTLRCFFDEARNPTGRFTKVHTRSMTSDAPPSRQSLTIPAAQMLKKRATWLQDWLRESPPWFTSVIVHTILLLILALVSSAPRDLVRPAFTLDSRTGDDHGEELFNSIAERSISWQKTLRLTSSHKVSISSHENSNSCQKMFKYPPFA